MKDLTMYSTTFLYNVYGVNLEIEVSFEYSVDCDGEAEPHFKTFQVVAPVQGPCYKWDEHADFAEQAYEAFDEWYEAECISAQQDACDAKPWYCHG